MWLLKSMKYWKQDFWDILEAVLCSYLEVWDIIIYSPNLTGLGQVRSLVIRDCDTKVTDHGWDRFICVRAFLPAFPALILMHFLSETQIPTTSWQTENNNDWILKPASWTHRLGVTWEQLLKAKGRACSEMMQTHPLTVPSLPVNSVYTLPCSL